MLCRPENRPSSAMSRRRCGVKPDDDMRRDQWSAPRHRHSWRSSTLPLWLCGAPYVVRGARPRRLGSFQRSRHRPIQAPGKNCLPNTIHVKKLAISSTFERLLHHAKVVVIRLQAPKRTHAEYPCQTPASVDWTVYADAMSTISQFNWGFGLTGTANVLPASCCRQLRSHPACRTPATRPDRPGSWRAFP
jgi:hypothetical protein